MFEETFFGIPVNHSTIKPLKAKSASILEDIKREYVFTIELESCISDNVIDTNAIFIKGDKNTSILKASITKNNRAIDLTGYTVTANIKEGSKRVSTVVCEIVDAEEGLIEINLPHTLVDERGINLFEISIQKSDKVIVSQQYKYMVLNSLGEGAAGEETQLTALQSLIQQVQESKNTVDNIVNELEVTQSDIDDILGMVGGL